MKQVRAAIFAALSVWVWATDVKADDVTLTSRDGSVELSGTLLTFDGEFYRIDTEYGVLTLDSSGVNCDGPGCPGLGPYVARFTLSGAPEIGAVLMPALIEGFALRQNYALSREERPGEGLVYTLYDGEVGGQKAAVVTLHQTSSSEGFAELLGEDADIVMSLRPVTGSERANARAAGLGDLASARQARVLALDALVPVVAPGNPVRRLSMRDLAAIYAGKITNWSALGGEDAPITAYLREPGEGFGDLFVTTVVSGLGSTLSPNVVRVPSQAALVRAVESDPFGIGIGSFLQRGNAEPVTLAGECGYELAATQITVKAEDYPLAAPMYLFLPERRLPKVARDFLAYLRSEAAQVVIRRAGLVDQVPGEIAVEDQGWRLANAIRAAGPEVGLDELKRLANLMVDQSRLSVTFRFQGGSTTLDASSLSNVGLLAHELMTGRFDGKVLTFAGFSDGQGPAELNRKLALRRARAVMAAVRDAAEGLDDTGVTFEADAFGEALPMACDDSAWGRRVNRRVEVWVQ